MPRQSPPRTRAWIVFAAAYLASVAATINQFKVPPALPAMIGAFGLDLTVAGLMMSVFAVIGVFLALPAGLVLRRLGVRWSGVAACLLLAAGSSAGAVSGGAGAMLMSRAIEGFGMGLIAVAMPTVISMWFSEASRGLPMGLWATWVPIGSIIMYNICPPMIAAFSWRAVWWLAAGVAVVAALLCRALLQEPGKAVIDTQALSCPIGFRDGLVQVMTCGEIWRVSLAFSCFTAIALSLYTFLPVFLTSSRGFALPQAAFTVSLIMSTTLFSGPLAGWVSDRIGSRRIVFSLPFLLLAFMLPLPFNIAGRYVPAVMVLFGLVAGGIPMAAFSLVPDVVSDRRLVGVGMAVLVMGQNAGMFIGPVLFGALVESLGWARAGGALVPVALLGFAIAWKIRVRQCVAPGI